MRPPRVPQSSFRRLSRAGACRRAAGVGKGGFGTVWRGLSPPVAAWASVFANEGGTPPFVPGCDDRRQQGPPGEPSNFVLELRVGLYSRVVFPCFCGFLLGRPLLT